MRKWKRSFMHLALLAYVIIVLYPFVFVLFSSVKTDNQAIAKNPWGLPSHFTLENYRLAWVNAKISHYFWNSFYISTVASIVSILLAAAAAFAVTRLRYIKMSNWMSGFLALGLFIPGNALLIPIYSMLNRAHLYNTPFALIIPYVAFALPLTIIILAAFMRNLPGEMEEAAVMDGLGPVRLFFLMVLPLTMPALVTVFIVNFLGNWNEFLMANFYLAGERFKTLPVGMVGFRDMYNTNYAQMSAGIVYSVLPVLIIYSILQEKIIEGVTAGSIKG